jgi:hypothetical protein
MRVAWLGVMLAALLGVLNLHPELAQGTLGYAWLGIAAVWGVLILTDPKQPPRS